MNNHMTHSDKIVAVLKGSRPMTKEQITSKVTGLNKKSIAFGLTQGFKTLKIKRIGQSYPYRWTVAPRDI